MVSGTHLMRLIKKDRAKKGAVHSEPSVGLEEVSS
jgi:hypothetical protein